jgi:beta-glucosidase
MWEIYPEGLYDLLVRLHQEYQHPNLIVLENGVPFPDTVENGKVNDTRRIKYLRDHIVQTHRALKAGVPVTGYFVWSLLDNFEWKLGYQMRFGLVYVDFDTKARILKESGKWYSTVVKANRLAS